MSSHAGQVSDPNSVRKKTRCPWLFPPSDDSVLFTGQSGEGNNIGALLKQSCILRLSRLSEFGGSGASPGQTFPCCQKVSYRAPAGPNV